MMDSKTLALSLLHAESEKEVISLLRKTGYWDDPGAWRLLGDKDGNYSTIGNQQARPEAALVEKIVNSVDARLLNECLVYGVDPESRDAPRTIPQAIGIFLDGKDCASSSESSIADWGPKKQLEQARYITIAVTGNKPRDGMPCITIADAGEGQTPARFPDTFLSIDKANKLRIPFVQGKFNMGGTGALKFCGQHSLQLIISRRNPTIISKWDGNPTKWKSEDPRRDEWGFTIVRRERPTGAAGEVRNSIFKYLAPVSSGNGKGQVLSFGADSLAIFPDENRPYVRESSHGTAIKLFEYDVKGFGSHAFMRNGLLTRLEALLPQIALPVRFHECRAYRGEQARSFATSLVGLSVRLAENRGENLEEGYPTTASFVVKGEKMTAQIYAFKSNKADSYRTNEGIIFAINGQTHGAIPKTFFERSKVKMGRLSKSLIVIIDCSQMSVGSREDLFMNSRDRLSNGELRKEIEEELEDIIGKHPGLRELREKRRREEIADRLQDSKPFEQVLDSILKSSPTLSKLFRFGQRLSQPNRADPSDRSGGGEGRTSGDGTFHARPHPTYFRFYNRTYGQELTRNAELSRRCRIRFETDAQNDYFERDHVPGSYEVDIIDGPLEGASLDHHITLHEGVAHWSIKLPEERLEVGDKIRIQCTVTDETIPEPFVNVAAINVTQKDDSGGGRKRYSRLSNSSGGKIGQGGTGEQGSGGATNNPGTTLEGGLEVPTPVPVKKNDKNWSEHGFDDYTACKVIEDEASFTFYVNVDNLYLLTEMKDGKEDSALQRAKFVWGNVLIGLALIHDNKKSPPSDGGDSVFTRIDSTTRALGAFLVPMIDHLGALSDEDVSVAAARGDDE